MDMATIALRERLRQAKAQLLEARVGGFTRVLGVTKLKKNYREFKDRRELVAGYSAFFCDERCVTMMPKLCGKAFFARNKAPLPVCLTRGSLAAALARARDSTWMRVGAQTGATAQSWV
jgi:ribosome biogenesis protein UTP30